MKLSTPINIINKKLGEKLTLAAFRNGSSKPKTY